MSTAHPGVIVGAYAASPTARHWDPGLERSYLDRLQQIPGVEGLEIPWITSLHPHEENWYADHLPPQWEVVITQIGGVMHRLASDPAYGLASLDPGGRERALEDVARIRDDVARLNDAHGRQTVRAVELHSAPATGSAGSSSQALAQSLRAVSTWDWQGAEIVIEHCDERRPGRPTAKGFLPLTAELQAIAQAGTPTGMVINWGRSAIEFGDPDAVPGHVRLAREAGLLRGVVFSGTAAVETPYGPAWADAHPSFAPEGRGVGVEGSLLTDERASATVTAAGPQPWLGLKVGVRPRDASLEERVALVRDGVGRVLAARRTATPGGAGDGPA